MAEFDRRGTITRLMEVRRKIAELEQLHIKDLKEEKKVLEAKLLEGLEVGEKSAYDGVGTVWVSEEIQPKVEDWEAVYQYIVEHHAWYLLPRKVNGAPFRDSLNAGVEIPGLEPVTIRKLNARKA